MGIRSKEIAFCTVLDDKYIEGAKVSLYTLLQSNPDFNYDLKILDWGNLSNKNKNILYKIYKKIEFIPVITKDYNLCLFGEQMRKWNYNCNYRFDMFLLSNYKKVVFFDCDFYFQANLKNILNKNVNIAAVQSKKEYIPQINNDKCFSAGFMIVGEKYLNRETRDSLIKLSLTPAPESNLNTILWSSDEPILNNFFINDITFINKKYNTLIYNFDLQVLKNKHNLHFNGVNKPWSNKDVRSVFDSYSLRFFLTKFGTAKGLLELTKILNSFHNKITEINTKYEL